MTLSIQNNNNRLAICFIKLENQTNKNLQLKNFSSLYFYGKLNKQMSKKENLYQYLFVQQILSKKSADFAVLAPEGLKNIKKFSLFNPTFFATDFTYFKLYVFIILNPPLF
jgi:hypothetical protein